MVHYRQQTMALSAMDRYRLKLRLVTWRLLQ
jgi:hypothetical protein